MGTAVQKEHLPFACATFAVKSMVTKAPGFGTQLDGTKPFANSLATQGDSMFFLQRLRKMSQAISFRTVGMLVELNDSVMDSNRGGIDWSSSLISVIQACPALKTYGGLESEDLASAHVQEVGGSGNSPIRIRERSDDDIVDQVSFDVMILDRFGHGKSYSAYCQYPMGTP